MCILSKHKMANKKQKTQVHNTLVETKNTPVKTSVIKNRNSNSDYKLMSPTSIVWSVCYLEEATIAAFQILGGPTLLQGPHFAPPSPTFIEYNLILKNVNIVNTL